MPIQLRIAGDGPLREEVLAAATSSIRYEGYVEGQAKRALLRNALALVMPSRCYENFPIAVMEANACGVPVIVSGLGGLAEMVESQENGMAFDFKDPNSFWAAAKHYFEADSVHVRSRCQQHAQKYFSQASFLQVRLKLYESLLSKWV